jgi:hypothetical protein
MWRLEDWPWSASCPAWLEELGQGTWFTLWYELGRVCRTRCSSRDCSAQASNLAVDRANTLLHSCRLWFHLVNTNIISLLYISAQHTFIHDYCQMWNNTIAYLLPRLICTELICRTSLTCGEMYKSRLNFLFWLSFDPHSISYPFLVALLVFRFCYGNTCFYYWRYSLLLFFIFFRYCFYIFLAG